MKKIILIGFCVVVSVLSVSAKIQYQSQNEQKEYSLISEYHYNWMLKYLNLSDAQKQKIQVLNKTARQQLSAKLAQEKAETDLILTDIQKKKISQNAQDKKDGMNVKLFDEVILTKDQQRKMNALKTKYKPAYQKLNDDYINELANLLTEQQKNLLEQKSLDQ